MITRNVQKHKFFNKCYALTNLILNRFNHLLVSCLLHLAIAAETEFQVVCE